MSKCLERINPERINFVFEFLMSEEEWVEELFGYDLILVKDAKERGAKALIPWVELVPMELKVRHISVFLPTHCTECEDVEKEFDEYYEYVKTQVTL